MKIRILLYLIVLSLLPGSVRANSLIKENERLLEQLDKLIADKYIYHHQREKTIADLKKRLQQSSDNLEKYNLCGSLFYEYLHYQADSSLYYVDLKQHYLPLINRTELQNEIYINRAEVLGVMGMYNEALAELQRVNLSQLDDELLGYYYRAYRAYCGWIADYTADVRGKQKYLLETEALRDTLMNLTNPGADRRLVRAESLIFKHQSDKAIAIMDSILSQPTDLQLRAYVNYFMSEAYEDKKDTLNQIKYLTRTAIIDIQMAVKEYASLQNLARVLYLTGDLDRAYRYLTCSMEDAVACNARLRFLQVTEFYPIIDKAYKLKEQQQQRGFRMLLISVSILAILLILGIGYMYSWNKKLSMMRQQLYDANCKLVGANKDLEETGKIKEVYIARYLDRCVSYLEKLEQYRRSLEKLAMASKINELFKAIRSEEFIRDERKQFYLEFDKSFLDLFPNFVEDFNNLLVDDGKIILKSSEQLNTELRIFALIRLGVTDATCIAHFLGYSLATVYNYRSKLRHKAKGDKDSFEQQVMNL